MSETKENKSKNANLHKARDAKKDEFYTQYQDIALEMTHYRQHFKNKVVYCNCDDPTWSNFWRYFHNNFASLGLKKLISTHYQENSEPSYSMEYKGGNDFDMDAGKVTEIVGDKGEDGKQVYTAGDFRSQACIALLKEADIVVTNPPFSLFREYIAQLMEHEKKFIIIGNINAVTYKEFFPLIKDNKVWIGASIHSGDRAFNVPDNYPLEASGCGIDKDGKKYIRVKGVRWYTNLDITTRHDGLWHLNGKFDNTQAHKYYEGNEEKYPKYDDDSAINVGYTKDIPIDYPDIMGVPITWLDKYNPDEFEIIWLDGKDTSVWRGRGPDLKGKSQYRRIFIKNLHPIAKKDDK